MAAMFSCQFVILICNDFFHVRVSEIALIIDPIVNWQASKTTWIELTSKIDKQDKMHISQLQSLFSCPQIFYDQSLDIEIAAMK